MKILHTSDWHLGKRIHEKETYRGTQAFLDWLRDEIYNQQIDCLIVAGDVFDTSTPTNQAKAQYYQFIASLVGSPCKSVVVIAGNHDSPSLINAPKEVLKYLNVHVVGVATPTLEDEVLEVDDGDGRPAAIIGVVPFLRERDIYRSSEQDYATDRAPKVVEAIKNHYYSVYEQAVQKRGNSNVPIILTGHLFAAGTAVADEEEREAYIVGNLGQVPMDVFPKEADYIALGHIHRPQILGKDATRNYSGSPYPMNFKEVGQKKYVRLIEFPEGQPSVTSIELPKFIHLEQLEGTVDSIKEQIKELSKDNEEIFVKAVVDCGVMPREDAMDEITKATEGTKISVLKFELRAHSASSSDSASEDDVPFEMTPMTVFDKLLKDKEQEIPEEKIGVLKALYKQVLQELSENKEDQQPPVASKEKDNEN